MRVLNLIYLLAIALSLTLESCKKKETVEPVKSNTELLCDKNWKIVKREESNDNKNFTIETLSNCELDDFINFSKNGSLVVNYGTNKCDPIEEQIVTELWNFNTTETGIYVDGGLFSYKINGSTLILETNYNTTGGFDIVRSTYTSN